MTTIKRPISNLPVVTSIGVGLIPCLENPGTENARAVAIAADDLTADVSIAAVAAKDAAEAAQAVAESEAADAIEQKGYAQEWATKAEDSLISVAAGGDGASDYSALHHAVKAADAQAGAEAAETDAEASLFFFNTYYLGVQASDPTVDNNGDPVVAGAVYNNSGDDSLRIYNGATWNTFTPTAVANFIDLADVEQDYSGDGGKAVKVNSEETGLEFDNLAGIEISYDNGTSGLTATDIQDAVDEVVSDLNSIVSGLGTMAAEDAADYLTKADNLGSIGNAATAFNNIKQTATTEATGVVEKATSAEILAGTTDKFIEGAALEDTMEPVALADGASISVFLATGVYFTVTLGGNRTLENFYNKRLGRTIAIAVTQDGTGSRTLAYGAQVEFGQDAAPVLSTTPGATDVLFFFVRSSDEIVYLGIRKGV